MGKRPGRYGARRQGERQRNAGAFDHGSRVSNPPSMRRYAIEAGESSKEGVGSDGPRGAVTVNRGRTPRLLDKAALEASRGGAEHQP
jgi:hypothetical protein